MLRATLHALLLAMALGALGSAALPLPPIAAAERPEITLHRLDNGLEVILAPEPGQEVISVQMWYRVGSRDETAGTPGMAHLVELLMFSGTEAVPSYEQTMIELGGLVGSATWHDVTLFYTDVQADRLERVLEIEADRMRGLKLGGEIVTATAQSIGYQLTRVVEETPRRLLEQRLRALAYGDHPYGHPTVRNPEALADSLLPRCREFYARYYRPDNACLIVGGGIDSQAALAAATATLGAVEVPPAESPLRAPLPAVSTPATRRDRLELGFGLPTLAIAYPIPGKADDELTGAAIRLLVRYLEGRGRGSWTADLIDANGRPEVAQVGVDLATDQHAGLLMVVAALTDGGAATNVEAKLRDGLAAVADSLRAFDSPTDAARLLDDLRQAELHQVLAIRTSTSARAAEIGAAHLVQGDFNRYAREREILAAVEWPELVRAAGLLQPARALVVELSAGR
jgi:zinc protease